MPLHPILKFKREKNLTYQQLGQRCGQNPDYLKQIATGQCQPSYPIAESIAVDALRDKSKTAAIYGFPYKRMLKPRRRSAS